MRVAAMLLLAVVLAGCGVDGPPEAPEPEQRQGVTFSGEFTIGIGMGF